MARRIFEVVIGIVLLVVAFILAFVFQQAYRTGVEYQSLPVPIAEIPAYTVLESKMFEMKDFPRALSGGYATNLTQLAGRISNSRIPAGLPIPLALVNPPEDYRLAYPSLEMISIPITPPSAVGGQVLPGEKVNIYRIIPPGAQIIPIGSTDPLTEPVTLIAENIPVVMALGEDGAPVGVSSSGHPAVAHVLVLAVTKDELDAILNLMAETKQSAIMWVTLAPVSS
jgi:Flp pilus assembly protein CpaB